MSRPLIARSLTASLLAATAALGGCHPTSHAAMPAENGIVRSTADLESVIDVPGPVTVETVVGADWQVPRSGLINLSHPKSKAAHLVDGDEAIVIELHALHHPTRGLYLVDTGVERALRDDPKSAALSGFAASYMGIDKLKVRTDTASWIAQQKEPVKGVFLTHLHLDHVSGMRDVPNDAVVYTGPGESTTRGFLNAFVRGPTDAALDGKPALREWRFGSSSSPSSPEQGFESVIDVFGDHSVWAIYVPGHTIGSTAYLARTPDGPVLFTGDACHTAFGWVNGVEPGSFSDDGPRSADSLARLRALVARHPQIDVRLGHQVLARKADKADKAARSAPAL